MSTNKRERLKIENGNSIRFVAKAEGARITLKGSGTIHAYVSNDGESYHEVEHEEAFENGVMIAPIACFIGDYLKFTAGTLTYAEINYSIVEGAEKG